MIRRNLARPIEDALSDTPVVFLCGPRQAGKSTLGWFIAEGPHPARYLTLDDSAVLSATRSDPEGFIESIGTPVVLDEVQRAPELLLAIKREVDRNRRPGGFLLTGSANVLLLPRVSDSLAGRMEILTLWPFSQGEIERREEGFIDAAFSAVLPLVPNGGLERKELLDRMLLGGYPEMHLRPRPERRKAWFGSYVTTLLQRDVRDISNIEGLADVPRLLSLLAARSGGMVNLASLSRDSLLAQSTLKRYLTLLQTLFTLFPLLPWSGGLAKRLVKAPKMYLSDTGLMASLLGLDRGRLEEGGPLLGQILENFVVMELRKQIAWSETLPSLFYFRTHTGHEVDVVLEDGKGRLVGIEVKASASVAEGDLRGLRTLKEVAGKRFLRGFVLYTGRQAVPFAKDIHALPISSLWRWNAHPT